MRKKGLERFIEYIPWKQKTKQFESFKKVFFFFLHGPPEVGVHKGLGAISISPLFSSQRVSFQA
jgi:hypothetical protein